MRLASGAPHDEVILFYAKEGLNVLAPLPGDIFRIVAPAAEVPQVPSAAFVQSLLDTRAFGPGQLVVTELLWGTRFHIHHRVADSYRAGPNTAGRGRRPRAQPRRRSGHESRYHRCDLTGQRALRSLAAGAPTTTLDAYGTAQRRRAEQVLKLTGRLTRIATLPRPLRPIRNSGMRLAARVPAVRRQLALQLSGLSTVTGRTPHVSPAGSGAPARETQNRTRSAEFDVILRLLGSSSPTATRR